MSIHPTAIVDPSAQIGKDVTIGPYAVIGPDVVIGDRCEIHSHAVLEYTKLGEESLVYPYASLGLPPQHFKYKGEKTRVETGRKCIFREGVTVHRGTMLDKGVTRIGNEVYMMSYSHVGHDCNVGDNVVIVNGALLAGHVSVGEFTFVSGVAGIHQFGRIGRGAMIAGGAIVVQDLAPFCIAQGDRATIRGLNLVGMKRMGLDRHTIRAVKEAYHTVFLSRLRIQEALAEPALKVKNEQVQAFRQFFADSKRGFMRPGKGIGLVEEEELAL